MPEGKVNMIQLKTSIKFDDLIFNGANLYFEVMYEELKLIS